MSFVPKRQRTRERKGFSLELALCAERRGQAEILASAFGTDSAGREWQRQVRELLADLATPELRRRVLQHFLRLLDHMKKHGSMFRVVDAAGFVGRAVESVRELDETIVDELTGEVFCKYKTRSLHVPAFRGGSAGGLAVREGRCPRTLHRYRNVLRGGKRVPRDERPRSPKGRYLRQCGPGGVLGSSHPKKGDSGAVMPKSPDAQHPYAQHWLTLPPSPEMLRRWGYKAPVAKHAPKVDLGSPALPRLPGAPEALRDVLRAVRER